MMDGSTKANLKRPSLRSGWSIKKLKELCSQIQDGTHFTPQYVEYGIPFYSVESVTARNFAVSKYVTQEAHDAMAKRCRPQRGDILMTRIGSLGDTAVVDWDHEASIYVSLALLRPGKEIDEGYLYAYTRSKAFVAEVESRSLPNAIPKKINLGDIGDVEIWVPDTLYEQQAIAAALSDADGVVAGLERVIAKKRLIKQGAMQDLLTARRRLPGFTGEWEVKFFGQIAKIRNAKVQTFGNPVAQNCIELEQVEHETGRILFWADATTRTTVKCAFEVGDVLFGRLRPYLRKFHRANKQGVCSTEIWPLMSQGIDSGFLYQVVQSDGFIAAACEAYGTHMPRADWGKIATYQIQVPVDLKEQKAIGDVLADMETEIQTLEARLTKARAVKEGMMQNLLTGRVRLV